MKKKEEQRYRNKQEANINKIQTKNNLSKSLPQKKMNSCLEIYGRNKYGHIVNDNFTNTFNPKRTSIDLNSFIQVFRKKVRQTSIAKQFQNSLEKFKSLSLGREKTQIGFRGNCKKQNQLVVQNNKMDNKIKKIIISDTQFKVRKQRQRLGLSQSLSLQQKKQSRIQQEGIRTIQMEDEKYRDCTTLLRKKKVNYLTENQQIQEYRSKNQSKLINESIWKQKQTINPQINSFNENLDKFSGERQLNNFRILETAQQNFNSNYMKRQIRGQCVNQKSIFTNRKLQTIITYQRPNLMYNLNLYRKKHTPHMLKNNKKNSKILHLNTQKSQNSVQNSFII